MEGYAVERKPVPAAQPEHDKTCPVLNLEMVRELLALDEGKGSFFTELVREFLALAEEMITKIEKAGREGDVVGYKGAVHTLKGAGLNIGALALGEHCRRMEQLRPEPEGGALHQLRKLLEETRAAFSRLHPDVML